MDRKTKLFILLSSIFITSLVLANVIGVTKILTIFGIGVPVGILPYPITFLATDLISEHYGYKHAQFLVWIGFLMNIFILAIMLIGFHTPPDQGWVNAIVSGTDPEALQTFDRVYGLMIRGTIASMIAYLAAQFCDVKLFHFWKNLTKGKHLWLRNNGSTLVSQLIDTVAVMFITFYGKLPMEQLLQYILFGYVFKLCVALIDTPFFYLGSYLFKTYIEPEPQPET